MNEIIKTDFVSNGTNFGLEMQMKTNILFRHCLMKKRYHFRSTGFDETGQTIQAVPSSTIQSFTVFMH